MSTLSPGANAPVTATEFTAVISHGTVSGTDIDVSAFLVTASGKVRSDADMCFYGQASVAGGALIHSGASNGETRFSVSLGRIPPEVEKVVFTAAIYENRAQFSGARDIRLDFGGVQGNIPCAGMTETALILAELYQRNGVWKVRVVGQGFNGGLAALATHLGVEIAQSAPVATPHPLPHSRPAEPAAAQVSLSKVSLTKQSSTVSLKKDDGRFGKIRVNLNWNQGTKKTSFFSSGSSSIDLDLGAFVETQNGEKYVIQALGNSFGEFSKMPYVKLLGDDRTGESPDGEWLEINGDRWSDIRQVLVYAFIYKGAPNWQKTDGMVRVFVPGQPEIEVRMNEYGDSGSACVVALMENQGGEVKVSRKVTFHKGQKEIDQQYHWGFRWTAGRK